MSSRVCWAVLECVLNVQLLSEAAVCAGSMGVVRVQSGNSQMECCSNVQQQFGVGCSAGCAHSQDEMGSRSWCVNFEQNAMRLCSGSTADCVCWCWVHTHNVVLIGAEWPAPAATDAAAVCCLYITSLRRGYAFLCWCGFFHILHVSGPDWPERHSRRSSVPAVLITALILHLQHTAGAPFFPGSWAANVFVQGVLRS